MPIQQITRATCDKCGKEIDVSKLYVDAMVYGATFHIKCWAGMDVVELAKLLGLDDIQYAQEGEESYRVY